MSLSPDLLAIVALGVIAAGHISRINSGHLMIAGGWTLFAIYWLIEFPYYLGIYDFINAALCLGAFPVFLYIAYHELLSYKWKEDYRPLSFLASVTSITGLSYFTVKYASPISRALVDSVARQSVWLTNLLFGLDLSVSGGGWSNGEYLAYISGVPVNIVLACTGIQAMVVAAALVLSASAERRVKVRLVLILLPIIYVSNLLRNVIVFVMVDIRGPAIFDFAHNVVGKGLSTVVLLILVLYTFRVLPSMYDDINGLFDLPWRRFPGHDYVAHFDSLLGVKREAVDGKEE